MGTCEGILNMASFKINLVLSDTLLCDRLYAVFSVDVIRKKVIITTQSKQTRSRKTAEDYSRTYNFIGRKKLHVLNENGPFRLSDFSAWSSVGGTVQE